MATSAMEQNRIAAAPDKPKSGIQRPGSGSLRQNGLGSLPLDEDTQQSETRLGGMCGGGLLPIVWGDRIERQKIKIVRATGP